MIFNLMSFFLSILVLMCDGDTLFLSPHHHKNLYAFDISSQKIISDSVLDITDTKYDSDDLHWRGMKVDTTTSYFYAANSKEDDR